MSTDEQYPESDPETRSPPPDSDPGSESESEPRTPSTMKSQEFTPLDPSSKLVQSLSQFGDMYDTLWPIIIAVATHEQRNKCLCYVNKFFAKIVRQIVSDIAKRRYHGIETDELEAPRPVHLDLDALANVEWASWDAEVLEFRSVENFRTFCALGEVDLNEGAFQFDRRAMRGAPYPVPIKRYPSQLSWIFISRNRDLVFETSLHNPGLEEELPYAHYFGITGRADKVKRMYEYVIESEDMVWYSLRWGIRGFI